MYKVLFYEPEGSTGRTLDLPATDFQVNRACYNGSITLRKEPCDLVLVDLPNVDEPYLDILSVLRKQYPLSPLVVLASNPDAKTLISSTTKGAHSFLSGPLNGPNTSAHLRSAIEDYRIETPYTSPLVENQALGTFVGSSPLMQQVYRRIGQIANHAHPALILGESGTGKELAARATHQYSSRKNEPFIVLDCSAIPPTLIESELFGHEKGSYTNAVSLRKGAFELAGKGTVFLDEIGNVSSEIQEKLLRITQSREFRRIGGSQYLKNESRIVAATNVDLERRVREGSFRQDLYHRLSTFTLTLPSLRDHSEDIPPLVLHFISQYASEFNQSIRGISNKAIEYLACQKWPGNVRQLENVIKRVLSRTTGPYLKQPAFQEALEYAPLTVSENDVLQKVLQAHCEMVLSNQKLTKSSTKGDLLEQITTAVEREVYLTAWRIHLHDQSKIARALGVSRPTVHTKLVELGLLKKES